MKKEAFNRELRRLTDRTQDVRACVGRVADAWKYNLADRSFGPAHYDPNSDCFVTELDLAVFLSALVERRAVITLSQYKGRRASTQRQGEVVVSKENRHGRLMGLTSNKDVFSFGGLVDDANVITASETGRPRVFLFQDITGKWYDGCRTIRFIADTEAERKIFEGCSEVTFKHFIHPNRWASFYSRAYVLAKVAIARLSDEEAWLKKEQRRIRQALEIPAPAHTKPVKTGAEKKEVVWAFNAVVDGYTFSGDYVPFPTTEDGLEEATLLRQRLRHLVASLRFHTRATEYAWWEHGVRRALTDDEILDYLKGEGDADLRQPSWATGDWETGWREGPRAGNRWARIDRGSGLYLRWRAWQKTERVAA